MSAFSTEVRVLTCPQCGAPIQMARQGGQAQCPYCHAPIVVAARDDVTIPRAGPPLTETERYQGLWTQSANFGSKQLPTEMMQVLRGGALTPDRIGPALALWRVYCQRASAGDIVAGENAVLLTGSISGYFAVQRDDQRQRAVVETVLDALREPSQKQVIRCQLARSALKAGDMQSAQTWFAACDPSPADLLADSAYRVTFAAIHTAYGNFPNVLAALGPAPGSVPMALTYQLQAEVLRANAIERSGDMNTAVAQLVAVARAMDGGRQAIPQIVAVNQHLQLCPQSLPWAMRQWG
jgi:DNA-directed RNA polymerase subunit RPC12/RpoP